MAAHQQFRSKLGDHISSLNLYRAYISVPKRQQLSWCQEHFVSGRSLHKATDIYQQLHQQLTTLRLPITAAGPEMELLLKALVAGLFTNAATRQLNGNCVVSCVLKLASGIHAALHLPVHTRFAFLKYGRYTNFQDCDAVACCMGGHTREALSHCLQVHIKSSLRGKL